MKDWHAVWSSWTEAPASDSQESLWNYWTATGQQWWAWWFGAVVAPWLRQPWPHAGQLEHAPAEAAGAAAAAGPRNLSHRAAPPAVQAHAPPQRKSRSAASSHKSRTLQRRKINPGG